MRGPEAGDGSRAFCMSAGDSLAASRRTGRQDASGSALPLRNCANWQRRWGCLGARYRRGTEHEFEFMSSEWHFISAPECARP
jgi:hypothetical protein